MARCGEYEPLEPNHSVSGCALKLATEMGSYFNDDAGVCILFPNFKISRMTELSIYSPGLRTYAAPPDSLRLSTDAGLFHKISLAGLVSPYFFALFCGLNRVHTTLRPKPCYDVV